MDGFVSKKIRTGPECTEACSETLDKLLKIDSIARPRPEEAPVKNVRSPTGKGSPRRVSCQNQGIGGEVSGRRQPD